MTMEASTQPTARWAFFASIGSRTRYLALLWVGGVKPWTHHSVWGCRGGLPNSKQLPKRKCRALFWKKEERKPDTMGHRFEGEALLESTVGSCAAKLGVVGRGPAR